MEFTEISDNKWLAEIVYKSNRFFAYGESKQEAGSNCFEEMQEYINSMQEYLNDQIK